MRGKLRCLCSLAMLGALATGCGGGSGGGSSGTGQVSVASTDAASANIDAFVVDVTSIQLTRENGAVVGVLSDTTRVDFAEEHELSDLLTAVQVGRGVYRSMVLDLDFSTADIEITDGTSTKKATTILVEDPSTGTAAAPTGPVAVTVALSGRHPLVIAPGIPAHLVFELDLDQSCQVDFASSTVTIRPVFHVDADLKRPKVARIRGLLKGVNTTAGTFDLEIHPLRPLAHGLITIATDASTQFDGNGGSGTGATGLAQLAAVPARAVRDP